MHCILIQEGLGIDSERFWRSYMDPIWIQKGHCHVFPMRLNLWECLGENSEKRSLAGFCEGFQTCLVPWVLGFMPLSSVIICRVAVEAGASCGIITCEPFKVLCEPYRGTTIRKKITVSTKRRISRFNQVLLQ